MRLLQALAGRVVDGYLFTGAATGQAAAFVDAGIIPASAPLHDVLESAADLVAQPRAQARARTGVTGSPAVLWVGRLNAGKDPVAAAGALRRYVSDHPTARAWFVASSDELAAEVRAELTGEAAARITLVGPLPHEQMADWYSSCDVFLSTSHHEGSGYALIEAMTCGCTPVVSDIAPHRAIVGDAGRRFAVGDEIGCARALAEVEIVDQAIAIADAAARLSWPCVANQLLVAYGIRTR
jgi:glycosyltransferase involved in cell wall biosynthesis